MEMNISELDNKECVIILFFEISSFVLQSNSARIDANAA